LEGANRYHSFTYRQYGNGAVLDGGMLSLSKIGRIRVRLHRPLQGTPKSVTMSREADGWYAGFCCAAVPTAPWPLTGTETGIDVGVKVFVVTAQGHYVENPRHHRKVERALKTTHRRVSRRKTGSKRWRKVVRQCAQKHQQAKRQRRDRHHKTAHALVRDYDVIYLEDLQVSNMSRRPAPKPVSSGGYAHTGACRKAGLNRSIQDAGWSAFRRILACKAEWAGKRVEVIPPGYTTQDCSGCGERVQRSLSVRTHSCAHCGLVMYRDENTARNMLVAGQHRAGQACQAPAVGGCTERSLRNPALLG